MGESTEELKANMEKAFAQRVEADRELTALAEHLNGGKGTYATAEDYAYRAGNILSGVFRDNIKAETLENGVFTKEFVEGTIIPLLKDDHRIVSSMAAVAQENVNTAAGVHIRAQKADFNQDRADGFVTKMDGKTMDEAGWMLGSPVSNFSQSVVDETMRKNGEVLAKAGKAATIRREAEAKCCDWCLSKAGSYDATNREAYQRHRECRCVIEMHLGGSIKRQTDWKHNAWEERKARIENRLQEEKRYDKMPVGIKEGEVRELATGEKEYGVRYGKDALIPDEEYIKSDEYRRKFDELQISESVRDIVCEYARKAILDNAGTKKESMYLLDADTGGILGRIDRPEDKRESGVSYTLEFKEALRESQKNGVRTIAIHNHGEGYPPSLDDFSKMAENKYHIALAVGANSQVYRYYNEQGLLFSQEECEAVGLTVSQYVRQGVDPDRAHTDVYKSLDVRYTILKGGESNEE